MLVNTTAIAQDQNVAEDIPLTITLRNRAVDISALEQRIVASHDSSMILRTMFR